MLITNNLSLLIKCGNITIRIDYKHIILSLNTGDSILITSKDRNCPVF